MSRDPNQLFIVSAFSRDTIAGCLNDTIEVRGLTHVSGITELARDDDALTDEICAAFAAAFEDMSEEDNLEVENNAAMKALTAMGWDEPEVDETAAERADLLRQIREYETQLALKRARLKQMEDNS